MNKRITVLNNKIIMNTTPVVIAKTNVRLSKLVQKQPKLSSMAAILYYHTINFESHTDIRYLFVFLTYLSWSGSSKPPCFHCVSFLRVAMLTE